MFGADGISILNYAAGAIAFFILAWLLVGPVRKGVYPASLVLAALVTSARQLNAITNVFYEHSPLIMLGFDIAYYAIWYTAIFAIVARLTGQQLQRVLRYGAYALVVAIVIATILGALTDRPVKNFYASNMTIWGNLLLALYGLLLIEQLYRNISITSRHAIKFFSLGLAAVFIYDLYLYSQMLIFPSIPADVWNARGIIYGIIGVFLIITLSKTDDVPQVTLSRKMVFYTTSLTGAGILLFLMSAVGYYVKLYGGEWGGAAQQVITFSGIAGLVLVSTVPKLRAHALVFVNKHFFSHKYDYRAEWLKLIDQLSQPVDEGDLQQRAIRAVSSIFDCPAGVLWLYSTGRYDAVASYRMPLPEIASEPDDSAFVTVLAQKEWVFESASERFPEDHALPAWAEEIEDLWIILPLLNENDLLGFMALTKRQARGSPSWEDLDLLKTVGRQVASYLARHQAAELLAQSRQFDAYNKLTAFIMHDLKNLIAQQALVVDNAAKHKENPAFVEDAISTIENSVRRMSDLLGKLQRREPSPAKALELERILMETIKKCANTKPMPSLRLESRGLKARADKDNLIMILIHIIKNAQEATDSQGFIDVRLTKKGGHAIIEVEDNGEGMSQDFIRERLFKPFVTTKSGKGMGIGVFQAREYIRNIGGDVTVQSEPNFGTTFTVSIPLEASEQEAA